jgi:hypothetical protein
VAVTPYRIDASNAGSVVESVSENLLRKGFLSACRNMEVRDNLFRTRRVWQKVNTIATPGVTRWLKSFSYTDTTNALHVLKVGDNGKIYHNTDNFASPLTMWDSVLWGGEAMPTGCAWRDDFFIAGMGTQGCGKNLRYRGLHGDLVGVSLDAPATAPTVSGASTGYGQAPPAGTAGSWLPAPSVPAVSLLSEYYNYADITVNSADDGQTANLRDQGWLDWGAYRYCVAFRDETDPDPENWIQGPATLMATPPGIIQQLHGQAGGMGFRTEIVLPVYDGALAYGQVIRTVLFRQAFDESTSAYGWMDWEELPSYNLWYIDDPSVVIDTNIRESYAPEAVTDEVPVGYHGFLVSFLDVTDGDAGMEFESPASPVVEITTTINGKLNFAGIPICAQAGRTIWRRFYRTDGGNTWTWAFDIENNADTTYAGYADAQASDTPYVPVQAVPVMVSVSSNPNGVLQWAGDVTNNQLAALYLAVDDSTPDGLALDEYSELIVVPVGTSDDPIAGMKPNRDGTFILKRDSIYVTLRNCPDLCQRILANIGTVASATAQVLGGKLIWMCPYGIVMTNLDAQELDMPWRFIGPDPRVFCLSETWAEIQKDKLKYAKSFHSPEMNIMGWLVQRCSTGAHNDTLILWDYGRPSPVGGGDGTGGGELRIFDLLCDDLVRAKKVDTDEYEIWGAFPLGYVGKMFGTEAVPAGDGCSTFIEGTVLDSEINEDGTTTVDVDDSTWTEPDDGVRGSIFHVCKGTGSRAGGAPVACDRADCLVISHDETGAGGRSGQPTPSGRLILAGSVALDGTSEFWIGGFKTQWRAPVALNDLDQNRQYVRAHVEVARIE